uniref:Uncharacterized protein n=1 Tax=viral metagenome TaxID=1070528 RepID=A0A6C0B3A6_9ZZZZ
MLILSILFIILLIYLYVKKNHTENFENPKSEINKPTFSKKDSHKNNGVSLNNNEGSINNSPNLLSKTSTLALSYTLYEKDEHGILLNIPNNYCEISIASKDEKIHIFLAFLNSVYHYKIDRYIYRNHQYNLILTLVINNDKHELYVNNKKLYYYGDTLRNDKSTVYNMTSDPIIINKGKNLKGILNGIITYNRILKESEIKEMYEYINNKFIIKIPKEVEILKPLEQPIKKNKRCNFNNEEICKDCSQTRIDLVNSKIIYESPECSRKIKGYCAANKDYVCDIIDIINKLGNN